MWTRWPRIHVLACASVSRFRRSAVRLASSSFSVPPVGSTDRFEPFPHRDLRSIDLSTFTPDRIRNFSVIAHIDHGKSTLSERLLEYSGTLVRRNKASSDDLYLDKLAVEKERGITVKAQTASMFYRHEGVDYLINLIDTPGHVDFSYEVSRSLEACQGCLLLVDATRGVQAQTMSNFYLAFAADLTIIPVINKVDVETADVARVTKQLEASFGLSADQCLLASGKTGLGVPQLLPEIIRRIPPPRGDPRAPPRLRVFDSWFDTYRGSVLLVNVVDGALRTGDRITSHYTGRQYDVAEVGLMYPEQTPVPALFTGQVGYVVPLMKTAKEARVGDTLYLTGRPVEALPGLQPAKPMVYAGIYPVDSADFDELQSAMDKLLLTDTSVSVQRETSAVLGLGFRCGFLGMLHMDVFMQRLQREYGAEVLATAPTVPYRARMKDGSERVCDSPASFPPAHTVAQFLEPYVRATIVTPQSELGPVLALCEENRGQQQEMTFLDESRVVLRYLLPLAETVASDFHDRLKSVSHGYASFDYEEAPYQPAAIVKVDVLLNGDPVDALSFIAHRDRATAEGRARVTRLRDVLDRQMFDVAIQAAVDGKVVARESLRAMRKDVTAKCYGGDITRKRKLLEKQKEGKRKMRQIGSVQVSQEAFLAVLKKDR